MFNGRAFWMSDTIAAFDLLGGLDFGEFCNGHWCFDGWPVSWDEKGWVKNLLLLELFPILVTVVIWGDLFRNQKACFHCDNLGVVTAINRLSTSSPPVVRLLQQLVREYLVLNAWVVARHVPGISNEIADSISQSQWERFRKLAPGLDEEW